jgi:uncharacterized protein YdaU (DUF1376 family)
MSEAPFVNFYTSDFLGGTSGMTAATKGVYITLLCLIYELERPLTQSRDALARRCGCTVPAFEKALAALVDDGKMQVGEGGIWSEKCEKHIASRRERRNSAKAAAEKRWQKSEQKQGKADATAYDPQCKPEPEPEIRRTDTNVSAQAPSLFDVGLMALTRRGVTEKQARSITGKWRSQFGEPATLEVFRQIEKHDPSDPVGYGNGILRKRRENVEGGAFGRIPERN